MPVEKPFCELCKLMDICVYSFLIHARTFSETMRLFIVALFFALLAVAFGGEGKTISNLIKAAFFRCFVPGRLFSA